MLVLSPAALGAKARRDPYPLPYPPELPGGEVVVTDSSPEFLAPGDNLREGVEVAKVPPTVDFMFYPGQDHPGKPWSVWGDGCAVQAPGGGGDKYYSAIGDHLSPRGTALVCEYDSATRKLRVLVNVAEFLVSSGAIPEGMDYTPGKVHSRIDMGSDGRVYFSTHRGSARTTTDEHGYRGDWILRTHPARGTTEIVAAHPVDRHCIPASVLDPERLVFYGGTAPGKDAPVLGVHFVAWDVMAGRALKVVAPRGDVPGGFDRYAILAQSTGKVYWEGSRYDPETNEITPCEAVPHVRSATRETPQGKVYGTSKRSGDIWEFDVKTEKLAHLGPGAVATREYTTTVDAGPAGRYLYYVPGGHGGGAKDGTPVVQFDTKRKRRKVIAFLYRYYYDKYGYTLDGTFGSALGPEGDRLYVTWNGMRKGQPRGWESCAMTVIHIPESERRP